MIILSITTVCFLAGTGFLAGFIDSIAGGGGLITVPALLASGMPPHITLGTNKLAATFGSFNAARIFIQRQIFIPAFWQGCLWASALGALIGVMINHFLPAHFLQKFLPVLIIIVAVYAGFFSPDKHRDPEKFKHFKPPKISSILMGSGLGLYDGCFGPGTGSFWTCLVMAVYRMDLLHASGVARVMNFVSNVAALITFMLLRHIDYSAGLVMGTGLFLGAQFGARSAIRYGAKFIRPVFLIVVIIMAVKVLWQSFHLSY